MKILRMYLCVEDTKIIFCHCPRPRILIIITDVSKFVFLYGLGLFPATFT